MTRNREGGYILAATLWILAAVAIATGYFAARVSIAVDMAKQTQAAAEAARDIASARAEFLFRFATTPLSSFGIGPTRETALALDGRTYATDSEVRLQAQDVRGLMHINYFRQEDLFNLLGQFGIPPEQRAAMLDTLADYTDTDDLKRLSGAEADEYRALGLPPPANDWLVSPIQLRGIVGWRERNALWDDSRFLDLLYTGTASGINPNTAPREILATLPGWTPEVASRVIASREQIVINDFSTLFAMTGVPVDLDSTPVLFFPANIVRLTLNKPPLPWSSRYQIKLTPWSDTAPWVLDYAVRTVVPSAARDDQNPPKLPPRQAMDAHAPQSLD